MNPLNHSVHGARRYWVNGRYWFQEGFPFDGSLVAVSIHVFVPGTLCIFVSPGPHPPPKQQAACVSFGVGNRTSIKFGTVPVSETDLIVLDTISIFWYVEAFAQRGHKNAHGGCHRGCVEGETRPMCKNNSIQYMGKFDVSLE